MSEQLQDEIISINSIYDASTISAAGESSSIYILIHPSKPEVSLRVDFPSGYPDVPPAILGTQSTGPSVPKGEGQQVVDVLRSILAEVYNPGIPCIFDLIEESTARLEQLGLSATTDEAFGSATLETNGQDSMTDQTIRPDDSHQAHDNIGEAPPWVLSDVVTEKKSVFVARAALVSSTEQAKQYVQHLLATDKKAAKAAHNITAWRIRGENDVQFQDCDDDGETAAGGRVLHLLELMGAWNVMIVITRWYGGVHLGPDRFRIINQVARDAVIKGAFVEDATKKKGKK